MSILSSCLRVGLRGARRALAPVLLLCLLGWAIPPEFATAAVIQRGGRGGYVVQLDAFASLEAAQVRLEALQATGLAVYVVKSEVAGKGTLYRVRHGRFATPAKARQVGAALQSRGVIESFFVAPYEPPLVWASTAAPKSNLPAPSSPPGPAVASEERRAAPPSAPSIRYQEVVDPSSGYSFQVPASWRGGMVSEADRQRKGIDAGATFQSPPDQAFANVIWNGLPNAHQKESELILAMILHGLRAGEGVKQMEEISRRVESTKDGIVRTHLELVATFQVAEGEPLLDFEGRAVVLQTPRGILLVSCFHGFDAPPETKAQVEHILASAKAP